MSIWAGRASGHMSGAALEMPTGNSFAMMVSGCVRLMAPTLRSYRRRRPSGDNAADEIASRLTSHHLNACIGAYSSCYHYYYTNGELADDMRRQQACHE